MSKKGMAAILAMTFLLLPAVSLAGDELEQMALRGLKGMAILVESIQPDAERLGLTKDQIQTDVELRLRKAGVRVLTRKEQAKTPGMPYLYVNVTTFIRPGAGLCAFSVGVELTELITLDRGFKAFGIIWNSGRLGTVGAEKIGEIREAIGDQVDKFINDYLAANPK